MNFLKIYIWVFLAFIVTSCNLTKEVDLNLPEHEPQMVVECYLTPGQPFVLTLVESVGYFEELSINYITDATVVITHNGVSDTLISLGLPLPDGISEVSILKPLLGDSLYTYVSFSVVPEDYNTDFFLEITRPNGDKLNAVTRILPPVPINSMEWKFNDDSMAFVLTKFQDDPQVANFYRYKLEKRALEIFYDPNDTTITDTLVTTRDEQDFYFDDDVSNGEEIPVGTAFDFVRGDTVLATLFHIPEDYYRFLETSDAAFTANLSPFGQPATVYSNIVGGIGVFTGLTSDEKEVVIE